MTDTTVLHALKVSGPRPTDLAEVAKAIGEHSELIEAARQVHKRRDNVLGLLTRALSKEEIAVMEDRGCRADDWALVTVAQDFDAFRVRRSHLKGACVLGRFVGDVEVLPGVKLATGIYNCTLINCQVGNDCLLENVRFAANVIIEREALVFDVGSITCSGAAKFGCGQELKLACEVGGRELPLWAEVTVDQAALVVRDRADRVGVAAVRAAVERYAKAIESPVSWVRRRARVRHIERLHDCFIGPSAVIDHALELTNVAVFSSADEVTRVGGGASVADSVLQWGVAVSGSAIVRRSVLLEHSAVDEHASVEQSLIGPNTTIGKGEVTASLVGPFVGFHHQSLLIAAYWPEGKGNIAYGAMVGSNHTSRAPDQEIWPGEGCWFGLGCAIRFPSDFSEAPYSVVGLGTSTLPQKVRFPFSLITIPAEPLGKDDEGRVPRAYNEIVPAWTLFANAYGLVRTESKFHARDKSRRHIIDYKVLRPQIMRLIKTAYDRLVAPRATKSVYIDEDIEGLGKNFLRESARLEAIDYYGRAMKRYALRILLAEAEGHVEIPGSSELAHELVDALMPQAGRDERLRLLVEIERQNAELVQASKANDDQRGARIIPGYADAHVAAVDDPIVRSAWERLEKTAARVRALGVTV
ncbi:MAG: DUF4954 family protein [Planctomycetes bacterium]|nr:DUF4954 family protein [Planctomycetota bacterium]